MKVAIGSDHAGFDLKEYIKNYLIQKDFEVIDYGTSSKDSCDYPIYGEKVAKAVASGECEKGVLVCGTGIGISISANKVHGIRCAVCSEPVSAKLTRLHNDANIIAFGSRIIGTLEAEAIVDAFFETEFEGGRHQKRIDIIKEIEKNNI